MIVLGAVANARQLILEDGINYGLAVFHHSSYPDREVSINQKDYDMSIEYALSRANYLGKRYGYAYTRQEAIAEITSRGYRAASVYTTATPTVTRTFTEPPTATERVRAPSTETPVYTTPTYPQITPAVVEPEPAGLDKTDILLMVGFLIGGLALGSVMRRKS